MKKLSIAIAAAVLLSPLGLPVKAETAAAPIPANAAEECKDALALCKVHCVEPSTACTDSEQVVETLKAMVKALTSGDLKLYATFLDEGCTTFDERTKKLIVGKEAVLEDMKAKFQRYGPNGVTPLVSYTIDHPYARVTGDTAVVTFIAKREFSGSKIKEESRVTDVFVRHDGQWKKLHYRGNWKRVS
jgi:ketosteroid isomerase-like protein